MINHEKNLTILLVILLIFLSSLFTTLSPSYTDSIKLPSCGPLALTLALNHFGISASDSEVAKLAKIDKDGNTTMYNLKLAAEKKGLSTVGMKLTYDELKEELSKGKSAIVHIHNSHFALLKKVNEKEVFLATCNPKEDQRIDKEEFSKIWKGYALILQK